MAGVTSIQSRGDTGRWSPTTIHPLLHGGAVALLPLKKTWACRRRRAQLAVDSSWLTAPWLLLHAILSSAPVRQATKCCFWTVKCRATCDPCRIVPSPNVMTTATCSLHALDLGERHGSGVGELLANSTTCAAAYPTWVTTVGTSPATIVWRHSVTTTWWLAGYPSPATGPSFCLGHTGGDQPGSHSVGDEPVTTTWLLAGYPSPATGPVFENGPAIGEDSTSWSH